MATLIQLSDFTGRYVISVDNSSLPKLQDFIDEVEKQVISELLGSTLGNAFIADANANGGVPADADYLNIYNSIQLDNCYEENYSSGIKDLLKTIVYFKFFTDVNDVSTNLGLKKISSSVSSPSRVDGLRITNIYNVGIRNYKVIQQYICKNMSSYPDYDGVDKQFAHPF